MQDTGKISQTPETDVRAYCACNFGNCLRVFDERLRTVAVVVRYSRDDILAQVGSPPLTGFPSCSDYKCARVTVANGERMFLRCAFPTGVLVKR